MLTANSLSRRTYKNVIHEFMPLGHPTIERAARKFGLPVSTLHPQLHEAGLIYVELVDEIRYEAACHMLNAMENAYHGSKLTSLPDSAIPAKYIESRDTPTSVYLSAVAPSGLQFSPRMIN